MRDKSDHQIRQNGGGDALTRGEEADRPIAPEDFRIPTGTELRSMRKVCGLSGKEAADEANVSKNYLYVMEREEATPSVGLAVVLLQLYRQEWPSDVQSERGGESDN